MQEHRAPDAERQLVDDAVSGSVEAWHEIVDCYTGLIHGMITRYLASKDPEEVRTVYVEVLESLRHGGLAQFEGRASLATWIGAVTRSRCMDYLRKQFGRQQLPAWLEDLSARDRDIYRLYFVEGLTLAQICRTEEGNPGPYTVQQVVDALDRIDARLDRSTRRRLAFELEARSVTAISGRLLEYLSYARQEAEATRSHASSESRVLERDAQRLLKKVGEALDQLDPEEREVIHWRYHEGLTADEVAQRMNLWGARRVYTVGDRALRKLRLLVRTAENR